VISQLASPSVLVVDEDPADFGPLLAALNSLYVSCIHVRGDDSTLLPKTPFVGLKLVFLDLHLSAAGGRDATSHTTNVFLKLVSSETAPLVVVIWSKYAAAPVGKDDAPAEDGETEAEAFKRTLLETEPKYKGRVIFVEMEKLKRSERPEESTWIESLRGKIEEALKDQSAVDLLWRWENLVRNACTGVCAGLTEMAEASAAAHGTELGDGLKDVMQRLAKAEGQPDFKPATAPHHLATVLGQVLKDHLEQGERVETFQPHGDWLGVDPTGVAVNAFPSKVNKWLLTSELATPVPPFAPGTVFYCDKDHTVFASQIGAPFVEIAEACFNNSRAAKKAEFIGSARAIFVELSPECDVAQLHRRSALLIAGALIPANMAKDVKRNSLSISVMPDIELTYSMEGAPNGAAILMFCARYKLTLPAGAHPEWLRPWFRLRELPTAALRISYSSQAVRVGYTSLGS
jgi:hypothetical protein